ncbi:MAG: outer membrane beta-barrel protein [Flavobacteriales bacterium]|nr:outer membrane beta-barrel protein [Flavobacteriales bacterium]
MRTGYLITAVLVPALLFAQVRQGPRLGLAVATQTAGQFLQWQGLPKFGPIVGWSWDIPYTYQVHILVEPMLMSKGSWTRNNQLNQNTFITQRYIDLPVLAKLELDTAQNGTYLSGGVVYGYWIYYKRVDKQDGQVLYEQVYDLNQPNVRRSQWSVALGLGRNGKRMGWELRAQTSVTPFDRLIRSQNLVFGLHLTYRLLTYEERKAKRDAKRDPEEENTE